MTDAHNKDFPTEAVLTTITGRVLYEAGISAVYEVLQWMTGESVMTHQIPRISREARLAILALHPELKPTIAEAEQVDGSNWRIWRDTWIKRYGATISVPKMTADQHERIDPLSELVERVHPDKIAVIQR